MQPNTNDVWWFAGSVLLLVVIPLWKMESRTRRTEQMLNDLVNNLGIRSGVLPAPSDDVKALAADPKKKIEAIRAYRQQSGAGLREAKEAVERLSRPT